MSELQNFKNHRQFVPLYHYVLALLTLAVLIGAGINFFKSTGGTGLYSASLLFAMALGNVLVFFYMRLFALKAQDRAIKVEEDFRSYRRNGSVLDSRLDMRQVIGLRFASDDEYDALAARAIEEGLSEDDIKKAIQNWNPDDYRA